MTRAEQRPNHATTGASWRPGLDRHPCRPSFNLVPTGASWRPGLVIRTCRLLSLSRPLLAPTPNHTTQIRHSHARPATTVIPLSSVRDRFSGSDGGSVRIQPDEGRTTLRAGDLSTRKLGRDDKGGAAPESRAHRRVVATGLGHSHLSPSVLVSPAPRPNTEPHHTNPPLARRPATTVIPLSSSETTRLVR
jgi:hypothetical protein